MLKHEITAKPCTSEKLPWKIAPKDSGSVANPLQVSFERQILSLVHGAGVPKQGRKEKKGCGFMDKQMP